MSDNARPIPSNRSRSKILHEKDDNLPPKTNQIMQVHKMYDVGMNTFRRRGLTKSHFQ